MKQAIEQAQKSIPVPSGYCVGAVLVRKRKQAEHESPTFEVVSTGFSRELPGNTHAEECCLLKLEQIQQQQQQQQQQEQRSTHEGEEDELIMYSTMEPCSHRLSGNRPCSDRLIASRVRVVYVGVREPDHFVQKVVGVENMVKHGLTVVHIPGLEKECLYPNRHILGL
ncbi:hypothetical protein BGW41_005040 [Actinomortierella wolfii]|nr:hypothetical protein BGW41_005040 [Actinomortierella wolfii]